MRGEMHGTNSRPSAQRRSVGVVLAMLTCSGLVALSEPAQACDFSPVEDNSYATGPNGDTTPPILSAADISIRRADDPGSNNGDCGGNGSFRITVDASDDQTERLDLGFSLKRVAGSFPFPIPTGDVAGNDDGSLGSAFVDEGEAFDGTLEVRVVDRGGNRSEPVRVSASGDEVGCSCSTAGAPSSGYAGFLPLAGLLVLVRRRFRRAGVSQAIR